MVNGLLEVPAIRKTQGTLTGEEPIMGCEQRDELLQSTERNWVALAFEFLPWKGEQVL